jgi:hypothetical protein
MLIGVVNASNGNIIETAINAPAPGITPISIPNTVPNIEYNIDSII